jgi:hypothetical protein
MKRYGIEVRQGSKATHFKLVKFIDEQKVFYTIAVHDETVLDCYVTRTRKRFKLTPKDGVSDRDFFGK